MITKNTDNPAVVTLSASQRVHGSGLLQNNLYGDQHLGRASFRTGKTRKRNRHAHCRNEKTRDIVTQVGVKDGMEVIKKYVRRYVNGWQQWNLVWKAGFVLSTLGLVGLLLCVWLTSSTSRSGLFAAQNRSLLMSVIAMIAVGQIMRFAGAVIRTKQVMMRRSRR